MFSTYFSSGCYVKVNAYQYLRQRYVHVLKSGLRSIFSHWRLIPSSPSPWYLFVVLHCSSFCLKNCKKRLLASSCSSVRLHATTLLTLVKFWWNLVFEHFSKICGENSSFINILLKTTGTVLEDIFTFVTISFWILLRTRNVWNKRSRENKNTDFMMNNFCPRIVPFMR
jgi:hypothetical protein